MLIGIAVLISLAIPTKIHGTTGESSKTTDSTAKPLEWAIYKRSNDLDTWLKDKVNQNLALKFVVRKYEVNYFLLYDTITCESGWNDEARGDNGKAFSLAQFHKKTFDSFAEKKNDILDYRNPYDQLELMAWAFDNNLEGHWTCTKKLLYN